VDEPGFRVHLYLNHVLALGGAPSMGGVRQQYGRIPYSHVTWSMRPRYLCNRLLVVRLAENHAVLDVQFLKPEIRLALQLSQEVLIRP
jgi:hypothetical protein